MANKFIEGLAQIILISLGMMLSVWLIGWILFFILATPFVLIPLAIIVVLIGAILGL